VLAGSGPCACRAEIRPRLSGCDALAKTLGYEPEIGLAKVEARAESVGCMFEDSYRLADPAEANEKNTPKPQGVRKFGMVAVVQGETLNR